MCPSGMMFYGHLNDAIMIRPKVCVTSRLEHPSHLPTPSDHHPVAAVLTSVYDLNSRTNLQNGLAYCEASERREASAKERSSVALQPVPQSCVEYSFQATARSASESHPSWDFAHAAMG